MWLFFLITVFSILVWGMIGNSVILSLGIMIYIIGIFTASAEDKIIYLFFLAPWFNIIGNIYYLIIGFAYIISLSYSTIISRKLTISLQILLPSICFILVLFITLFFRNSNSLIAIYLWVVFLSLIITMLAYKINFNIEDSIIVFAISLVLSSIIGFFIELFPFFLNYSYLISGFSVFGTGLTRFAGLTGDPNFYSFNIMMGIVSMNLLYRWEKVETKKNIYFILTIVLSILGFLSFSNTFIISWLLNLLFFFKSLSHKNKIITIFITMFVSLLLFILFSEIILEVFYGLSLRRPDINSDLDSITNGRSQIWSTYIESWTSDLHSILFGKGNGAMEKFSAHSSVIRFFYMFGITGSSVIIVLLLSYYRKIKSKKSTPQSYKINIAYLIPFLIFSSSLDIFTYVGIPFIMIYIILIIYILNANVYGNIKVQKIATKKYIA